MGSITTMLKEQGEEPSASSRVGPSISEVSARGKVMKEGGNRDEMGKKYSSSLVFSPSDPVDASWWPNVTESQQCSLDFAVSTFSLSNPEVRHALTWVLRVC